MLYSFYQNLEDGPLLTFMECLINFLESERARLNILEGHVDPVKAALADYKPKFLIVAEDGNHGRGDVAAKNQAKAAAIAVLDVFVGVDVRYNKEWTPKDLADAGWPSPNGSGAQGKHIEVSPIVGFKVQESGLVKVHGQCKGRIGRGMPAFALVIEFAWEYVRADGSIPAASETTQNVISFRAAAEIEVPQKEKTREIVVYARYHNHFPKPGLWSAPVIVVLI